MPESDAGLAQVVGRHFDIHFVSYTDADEVFAHFPRDVSQHLVTVGQSYSEHRPGQDLRDRTCQFNWFFLRHLNYSLQQLFMPAPLPEINSFPFLACLGILISTGFSPIHVVGGCICSH